MSSVKVNKIYHNNKSYLLRERFCDESYLIFLSTHSFMFVYVLRILFVYSSSLEFAFILPLTASSIALRWLSSFNIKEQCIRFFGHHKDLTVYKSIKKWGLMWTVDKIDPMDLVQSEYSKNEQKLYDIWNFSIWNHKLNTTFVESEKTTFE